MGGDFVPDSTTHLDRLRSATGFILDMDGVMYRGMEPISGVSDFLATLELRETPYKLATNNSTATPAQYVERLDSMGVQVRQADVITSGVATRAYLLEHFPAGTRVFAIGEPALFEQLFPGDEKLIRVESASDQPNAVVVGLDRNFTYAKLYEANTAIRGGATYIATNTDATLPTERGLAPGCGTLLAAVTTSTGQSPAVVGKPETMLYRMSCDQMGISAIESVAIGDRLDTDIAASEAFGSLSVMVLTGVSTRDDIVRSPYKPDLVFSDLNAISAALS